MLLSQPGQKAVPAASGSSDPPGGSENLVRGIGLEVVMSRIQGETEPGILTVPYMFQCPPLDSFEKGATYSHLDFETVRWGQYSRQSGVQLRTVQFDTLILNYKPSWSNISPDPENASSRGSSGWQPNIHAMCDELESICRSGSPFRLRAFQPAMWGALTSELDWKATMRELRIAQRAGEPETRYITASFTEWRKIGTNEKGQSPTGTSPAGKTIGTNQPMTQAGGNSGAAKGSTSQYISASDLAPGWRTLYDLSKQTYGSTVLWTAIAQANPQLANLPPSSDIPDSLKQDMRILLPKVR
jgi:hypothetical protein